jgi:hypothetical protein
MQALLLVAMVILLVILCALSWWLTKLGLEQDK